ncbi:MAG: sigma-54 dependent transcriptional regulator [Bacteroidales bacterium]|jgi:two-component system NtrC family response regulator|nr:sigma-54 dependent transcriptional regulator [Bacteroidales bacterium]
MILIVDDDSAIRSSLLLMLKRAGYEPIAATCPKEAINIVRKTEPELILTDMNFTLTTDGEEGLLLLKQIKIFRPDVPVILMTAWGSIKLAVKGMKAGAFDFITKPWNNIALLQRIKTALEISVKKKSPAIKICDGDGFDRSNIIGKSEALTDVLSTIKRIAATDASVLITGESGTGKELIAQAIHNNSPRANNPFVKVNLGGISSTLFESEMFGHKKGAFTDAYSDRKGRFEMADKGTIFLDEIGELDLGCQVKLLRVLQEQTFEVLGDSHPKSVNIRVISATNADLPQRVLEHTFREDLFYRINLITVKVPALRERRSDIPLLARHFAKMQSSNNKTTIPEFSDDAMEFLCRLPYPGNVRELKNMVERTILVCNKNVLTAGDFRSQYQQMPSGNKQTAEIPQNMTLNEIERQAILQAMDKYNGNISQIARSLGISRTALYRRLEKYGINTE